MHLIELRKNIVGYYMQEPMLGRAQPPTPGFKVVYWEHAVQDSPSCSANVRN